MKYQEWVETVDLNECDDILCVAGLAWDYKQKEVDMLNERIKDVIDYIGDDFDDYYTGVMIESIHKILKGEE